MRLGRFGVLFAFIFTLVLALGGTLAYAQGGATSTLQGTVKDSTGAILPGADVVAKDQATGTSFTTVSGSNGGFAIPSIPPGTYTVTVSLMSFKTAVLKNVSVTSAGPVSVVAVLELGNVSETVIVEGSTPLVQTQSTSVTATLNVKLIASLPLVGRGAFDFVSQMPGVNTSTGSSRDAIVNGLPQASVNITLDGMNIQDNYAKSWDGMFTRVSPRIDAVEELSISSAANNAADASQGGVQVRFVTRSGTNQYKGSLYYYLRTDKLNTNTWFNLHRNVDAAGVATAKPVLKQYQPGGRLGGPIWKDKAFFFVNYEWISSPGTSTLRPTVMSPNSERGIFQYVVSGVTQQPVDLLALAASKGYTSAIDPTVAKTIAAMRSSMSSGTLNATTDPLTQEFVWQMPTASTTKFPTVRLDYNVTPKHRLSFTTTYNHLISDPDTTNGYYAQYPGFPNHGTQDSVRYSGQLNLRSVLSSNMVNEFRVGATGGATKFFPSDSADMFSSYGGYALGMTAFKGIANPYSTASNSSREGSTRVIEDTLSWLKGKHSISVGANVTRADVWLKNQQFVPTVSFGIVTNDPADAMFTTTNFPNASSTDLTNARNLYAVLTGRVSAIGRNARIAEDGSTFVVLGESFQKGRMWDLGFFLQDSWRVTPSITVNAGLRYALQLPFQALNNSYSSADMAAVMGVTGAAGLTPGSTVTGIGNLFKPGTIQGTTTTYSMLKSGTNGYNLDKNNFAPSIGVAWTIGADKGIFHSILGSPGDSVLRAGYGLSYQRPGMSDFTGVYGSNPGVSIDATRNITNGNLGTPPLLLGSGDMSAPNISLTRTYPMGVPTASTSVYAFDPNIQVPWSSSFTVGVQRALGKTMSLEARYVHTNSGDEWTNSNLHGYLNYNEINVVENGFANEFRVAQSNLQANIAAGKGNTFAYTGAGTTPLPIFLAYINGSAAATDTTKYTGSGWTNTTLVGYMYPLNPNVLSAASNLRGNATYKTNALTAGLAPNFFVANPDVSGAYVQGNGAKTRYDGIQIILNRRFSQGLQLTANYSFGKGYQGVFYSFHLPYVDREQTYNNSVAGGPVNHMFRANWVYELPFGQGKPFGRNVGKGLQRLIGGWMLTGTAQLQSGRRVDFGNVRLVGFSKAELQKMVQIRKIVDPANNYRTLVYYLPDDIIQNTVKAFSVNATGYSAGAPAGRYFAPANGPDCLEIYSNSYGQCGQGSVIITGPKVFRVDMSLIKEVPIVGSVAFRFEAMVFNVFNTLNLTPNSYVGSTPDSYQITGAVDQSRTMQLAFRITW